MRQESVTEAPAGTGPAGVGEPSIPVGGAPGDGKGGGESKISGLPARLRRAALSLRAPILLLLLVPLAGLVGFGGWGLTIKYQQAVAMHRVEELSDLIVRVSGLLHETQRERGLSSGFLGSGGKRFEGELEEQRQRTDEQARQLRDYLTRLDPLSFGPDFSNHLALALNYLDNLPNLRQRVADRLLGSQEAIESFTRMNGAFLDMAGRMVRYTTDSHMATLAVAYINFLWAKERTGVERALMTGIFSRDHFLPVEIHLLSNLVAGQEALLQQFATFSETADWSFFQQVRLDESFHQVEAMRAAAYQRWDEESLGVDAGRWYAAMTRKIDLLKTVEDRLAQGLRRHAEEGLAAARRGFLLYFLLTLAVMGLALVAGRQVGIYVLRLHDAEREAGRRKEFLEREVDQRTLSLTTANVRLQEEVEVRSQVEGALKHALATAEEATAAKGRFLATMSHEIRTPLNGILGLADLLQTHDLPAESRRFVESIQKSGQVLLGTINNILDFSKIEAGRLELEATDFNLRELVGELGELFSHLARRKGVGMRVGMAPGVPLMVNGDPVRLRQILINLLGNGVKFTEEGYVSLEVDAPRWDQQGGVVRFVVGDTGIGMSEAERGVLFQPFAQADASITRRYGGTGLGLVIAGHLVSLMGGTIKVTSEPGRGSRFTVQLPLRVAAGRGGVEAAMVDLEQLERLRGVKLLLVEDDPLNRQVVMGMLQRYGIHPRVAADGQKALALLEGESFDLVVMDCQMPVMDGYATCRLLRQREAALGKGGRVPVIAFTAHAMEGDRERCLAAGMDDYLTKPVRRETLLETLLRWLPAGAGEVAAAGEGAEGGEEHAPDTLDRHFLERLREDFGAELGSLVGMFLELLPDNLEAVKGALAANDAEGLALAAHTLKGRCRQLGLRRLGLLAQGLEEAAGSCRLGDATCLAQARKLVTGLEGEGERAAGALRQVLAEMEG